MYSHTHTSHRAETAKLSDKVQKLSSKCRFNYCSTVIILNLFLSKEHEYVCICKTAYNDTGGSIPGTSASCSYSMYIFWDNQHPRTFCKSSSTFLTNLITFLLLVSTFRQKRLCINMTDHDEPLYSVAQQAVLTLLPSFTGTLSVLGSIAIIYIILQDRKKKLSHVYHRLVFTMSCLDIFNSTNYALSSLVVPKGTPNVWGAHGTIATCSASGFIMQLGAVAVPLYSGCLALYYLMMIRYRVKERFIAKWVEPFMHIIAFGYPLVSAIIPLLYKMYNPMTTMVCLEL
jgi:hypothetical protein